MQRSKGIHCCFLSINSHGDCSGWYELKKQTIIIQSTQVFRNIMQDKQVVSLKKLRMLFFSKSSISACSVRHCSVPGLKAQPLLCKEARSHCGRSGQHVLPKALANPAGHPVTRAMSADGTPPRLVSCL